MVNSKIMENQNTELRNNSDIFFEKAFSRNIGIASLNGQQKMRNAKVAVAGLGGVGGNCAYALVRLGIGKINIADNDTYSPSNLNRQLGSHANNLDHAKSAEVEKVLREINPHCEITNFHEGVTEENVEAFLKDVDIVIDAIDYFAMDAKELLFKKAREKNLFVISAASIGVGSSLMVFDPQGMSFNNYFNLNNQLTEKEKLFRVAVGTSSSLIQRPYFKPEKLNLEKKEVPSIVMGTLLAANLAATEVMRFFEGRKMRVIPKSLHVDPYVRKMKKVWLPMGNKNPIQVLKMFIYKKIVR